MSIADSNPANKTLFLMGNEAIARGALEAGVQFAAGYPGTPSSEILQNLANAAKKVDIHAEWSINEKVASESAGAAAFAGLKSIATMKNAGLSVALDFLTHISYSELGNGGGAMVVAVCDDPDGHSSGDETDSRWIAKFASAPLLEPSSVPEAKEMTKYAFELSEEIKGLVMLRSYTRLSHASSTVELGKLPKLKKKAFSDTSQCISPYLAKPKHKKLLEKLEGVRERFEKSPFNRYEGPAKPEVLIVCSGSGRPCSVEAIDFLGLQKSVGILILGAEWPFPKKMVTRHLKKADQILVVEEVDPFLEIHVKETLAEAGLEGKKVYGKGSGHIPVYGEITPDRATAALAKIFKIRKKLGKAAYPKKLKDAANEMLISRGLTWCPGCPHRASFWALEKAIKADGRDAYMTGDIGCYTLDVFPEGKNQLKALHAMGSNTGMASGLGQLGAFGYTQPVLSLCGDSTFFHASVPALINAIYNNSNMIQVVLDNDVAAMTGFQPHPGTGYNVLNDPAAKVDMEQFCRSLGCVVEVSDPFDVRGTIKKTRALLKMDKGVRVLILRRSCELLRMRRDKTKPHDTRIDPEKCKGAECAICSSAFRCSALVQDVSTGKAIVRQDICSGCGVCVEICPFKAISKEERAA
jgi:indolepyruvate ferredoxin oxidoreductase alpha subunit